jgi:hypothetical protein
MLAGAAVNFILLLPVVKMMRSGEKSRERDNGSRESQPNDAQGSYKPSTSDICKAIWDGLLREIIFFIF